MSKTLFKSHLNYELSSFTPKNNLLFRYSALTCQPQPEALGTKLKD